MERISILRSELKSKIGDSLLPGDEAKIQNILGQAINDKQIKFDVFGFNPIVMALQTALIAVDEIGLRRDGVIAIILYNSVINGYTTMEEVRNDFGDGVARDVDIWGTVDMKDLYQKFDFSIPVGISYQFKAPITIDARYQIGLTRLNKETFPGVKNSKNSVFTLTIGYKFAL